MKGASMKRFPIFLILAMSLCATFAVSQTSEAADPYKAKLDRLEAGLAPGTCALGGLR